MVSFYNELDCDWSVNPFWKVDLDCQSQITCGFGLDWQSEKMDWAIACMSVCLLSEVRSFFQKI